MGDFITPVLWAYRTSKRGAKSWFKGKSYEEQSHSLKENHTQAILGLLTQATPFSLVYGAEAMVLTEVMVPSACVALASKVSDSSDRVHEIKALEEKR